MRIFVINLDRDHERLASFDAQMRRLRLDYERFPAVWAAGLSKKEKLANYSPFRWWCAIGWKLRDGELGITMSHNRIYRKMIEEGIPYACIFEDDVLLADHLPQQLETIACGISADVKKIVLMTNYTKYASTREEIVRTDQCQSAEAYVITRAAAESILQCNTPIAVPCDHWRRFCRWCGVEVLQAFPIATIMHVARFGSYSSPPGTEKLLVGNMSVPRRWLHKFLRCVGITVDVFLMTCFHGRFGGGLSWRRGSEALEHVVLKEKLRNYVLPYWQKVKEAHR